METDSVSIFFSAALDNFCLANLFILLDLDKLQSEADRMCPEQPLTFDAKPNQPKRLRFNLRTLSELPYHLAK